MLASAESSNCKYYKADGILRSHKSYFNKFQIHSLVCLHSIIPPLPFYNSFFLILHILYWIMFHIYFSFCIIPKHRFDLIIFHHEYGIMPNIKKHLITR